MARPIYPHHALVTSDTARSYYDHTMAENKIYTQAVKNAAAIWKCGCRYFRPGDRKAPNMGNIHRSSPRKSQLTGRIAFFTAFCSINFLASLIIMIMMTFK